MKIKEITELADKDLREKLGQSEEAYKQMKLNHQISPLENPSQIKAARRDIARMKTVLRQRELNKE
jgi:large subunit ribosomal protein L29